MPAIVKATLLAIRALPAIAARVFNAMPPNMLMVENIPRSK